MPDAITIDDLSSPRLPFPIAFANRFGGSLARRFVSLEAADLLEAARQRSGLANFGDASFLPPLRLLLECLEGEAQISALGRFSTRQLLLLLLTNRLRLEDLIGRHPEILEERIERPIIIAGLPRTGTTHLLNLVSQDPDLRSLPFWESLEPVLPASESENDRPRPGLPDPRIARCERGIAFQDRAMPHFRAMHEFSIEAPHEEIQLMAMQFSTQLFEASYEIPTYGRWLQDSDQTPAYRYTERCLKALQWLRGPRRWVLKTPQHLENLGPLTTVFPDAYFVQTHRDPLRVVASLATMIAYGRRMNTRPDALDPVHIGRYWARRLEGWLRDSVRDRQLLPADRVFDVHFGEFMKDDVAMVRRVFAFAQQPWTDGVAKAIGAYMDANPRGKHGTIAYPLAAVGLDADELRESLRFYQDHFDVPSEP